MIVADQYTDGLVQNADLFDKAIIVSEICWVVIIWMVKYSILAFYWRLFSANSRAVRIIIWALAASVTCWGIIVVCLYPSQRGETVLPRQISPIFNDDLGASQIFSMFTSQVTLGLFSGVQMSLSYHLAPCALRHSTYYHRYSAPGTSGATYTEA